MGEILNGVLHCHDDHSILDGGCQAKDLVLRAKELGARGISLENNGTLVGFEVFYRLCKDNEIKPLIGCKLYVKEDDGKNRLDACVIAKDYIGLQAIQKILTDSNKRIEQTGKIIYPCSNREIFEKHIGPNAFGHDHVILRSAGLEGIIAGLSSENEILKKELEELERLIYTLSEYQKKFDSQNEKVKELSNLFSEAKKVAVKEYKKEQKAVETARRKNQPTEELERDLYEKVNYSKRASETLPRLEADLTFNQQLLASIKDKKPKTKLTLNVLVEKANELKRVVCSDEFLYEKMKNESIRYQNLVGKGNFYLELQNHGIDLELKVMPYLARISSETGIPVVAANDVHIISNNVDDVERRSILLSLRKNEEYKKPSPSDFEFYMKTDRELLLAISQVAPYEKAVEAMENIGRIIDVCDLVLPNDHHYPVFDKGNANSDQILRDLCYKKIPERFAEGEFTEEYQKRLEYELDVICEMGFPDYHLIDQDFLNVGRKMGKLSRSNLKWLKNNLISMSVSEIDQYLEVNAVEPGLAVGPGRGSAAGSLVCFILGITSVDPIKYNLLFERFLNIERVTMPDIDSDFANGIREMVIEYVRKKYGEFTVCFINTESRYGAKGALDAAGRIYGLKLHENKAHFTTLISMIKTKVPNVVGVTLSACVDVMIDEFSGNQDALEIIRWARLIENYISGYSSHAAGVIISDNDDLSDYVALAYDVKKDTWKAQCDMNETESKGLLKMDFLGLKNLNVLTLCAKLIYERYGIFCDLEKLPIEPEVIKEIYGRGRTNSVFQVESAGMTAMYQELGPDNIEDVIMGIAAYRPGPMDSIPGIIAVKNGKEPLTYLVPEVEPILNVTYGYIIYQEQVMQIFQDLAGYSLGQADIVRRAMSKKKMYVLEKEKEFFVHGDPSRSIDGCIARGIPEDKAIILFDTMLEFAKYAFNKSHAAAYGLVSYQTAWCKYHYPLEYYTGVLSFSSFKKYPSVINECKKLGISFLPPDINGSEDEFSIKQTEDGDCIQFGLSSIKGLNDVSELLEEREKGKFKSFADVVKRFQSKKVLEGLIMAGAFDVFCKNRKALMISLPVFEEVAKEIKKQETLIEDNQKMVQCLLDKDSNLDNKSYLELQGFKIKTKTAPTVDSLLQKIEKAKAMLVLLEERFEEIEIPLDVFETKEERLAGEKQLLGVYLSGHPLESYKESSYYNCTQIDSIEESKKWQSVMGIVISVDVKQRKSDGADMAFLVIEDKTGEMKVNCFTKCYKKYSALLTVGSVLKFTGNVEMKEVFRPGGESDNDLDEGETDETNVEYEAVLSANEIEIINPEKATLLLEMNDISDWVNNLYPEVMNYEDKQQNGYRILVRDISTNEIRQTSITVTEEFLRTHKRPFTMV